MPWQQVELIRTRKCRGYCRLPYPGHSRGCPNWGKNPTCPPQRQWIGEILDLDKPTWVVWTTFDLATHVQKLKLKHPNWSDRQLYCLLYWQDGARANLKREMRKAVFKLGLLKVPVYLPEATGVNVDATMKSIGITLEWPPRYLAYQVAVLGTGKN